MQDVDGLVLFEEGELNVVYVVFLSTFFRENY